MAITRTEINADLTLLKTALESTGLFGSVTLDNDSSPTTVTCKDEDDNTLLLYSNTGSGGTTNSMWSAYKDSTTYASYSIGGTNPQNRPKNFFKVGSNGAAIQLYNGQFVVIGKLNTGGIGVAIQDTTATVTVGCWGDDADMTTKLTVCATSSPMAGNHVLFVPVPMHGSYNTATYMTKAFFLPMAQNNMRGVVQEVTGDAGTYITNGYLAMVDDAGGEA